jgi:hypothetical protein
MKTSQKGIMSCAGSIRGAIAFGLAISIETTNKVHKEILVGSTLILVFFTTIVFGALMPLMISIMKKLDGPNERQDVIEPKNPDHLLTCDHFNFLHPNFSELYEVHKEKNIEVLKTRISYWLGHYWIEFDEMIIKPWLCYQWPWNFTDNMNVKKIILTSIKKYEDEEKNKTHFIRGESPIHQEEEEDNQKQLLLNSNDDMNKENKDDNKFESSKRKMNNKNYVELNDLPESK